MSGGMESATSSAGAGADGRAGRPPEGNEAVRAVGCLRGVIARIGTRKYASHRRAPRPRLAPRRLRAAAQHAVVAAPVRSIIAWHPSLPRTKLLARVRPQAMQTGVTRLSRSQQNASRDRSYLPRPGVGIESAAHQARPAQPRTGRRRFRAAQPHPLPGLRSRAARARGRGNPRPELVC